MSGLVCPRLYEGAARARVKDIAQAASRGGMSAVRGLITYEHRDAIPVETGRPISSRELLELRTRVVEHVNVDEQQLNRDFDLKLGRALRVELPFITSDLFHGETWNFLTLCIFPDYLYKRFPDLSEDRAIAGTRRRNALQRVWIRERLLGEVLHLPEVRLKEDELEQVIGRSSIARVPGLPVIMVEELVRSWPGSRPEQLARLLGKRIVQQTGVLHLDALSRSQLRDVIRRCAEASAEELRA